MSGKRKWRAFVSALGLEAIIVGVVIAWALSPQQKLAQQVVALTIEPTAPPTLAAPLEPEKITRVPTPVRTLAKPAAPIPALAAVPLVASPLPETTPTTTVAALPPAPVVASVATPAMAAAPAPAAAVDPSPAYNAKIAAAVQSAFQIPAAASTLGFKGRTRVEFSLREGSAHAIRIALTSGFGAVDRAAVQAVQSAIYPAPPSALAGKEGAYQIWVACY